MWRGFFLTRFRPLKTEPLSYREAFLLYAQEGVLFRTRSPEVVDLHHEVRSRGGTGACVRVAVD